MMDFKMLREELRQELAENEECRNLLYRRGYLITGRDHLDLTEYPFYGNWSEYQINEKLFAYVHHDQHIYMQKLNGMTAVLIGHAYDPFTGEADENCLLRRCLKAYQENEKEYFNVINELTGIYIIGLFSDEKALIVQDCIGMKACYYANIGGEIYITSHCSLVADLDNTTVMDFADRLMHSYAYSHLGSEYLPGDITVFNEVRRLGPNLCLRLDQKNFRIERFFPRQEHPECAEDDMAPIGQIADILHKNVELCARKWSRPAISLSGGLDSRTTLSSANGCYDRFRYYSFFCKEQEIKDANAAHAICGSIDLSHTIYPIPTDNSAFPQFDLIKKIIAHNCSYVSIPKDHEVRKYIFLSQLNDFDVELKSWVSEIGRVYWDKRFGFDLPQHFSPRDLTVFQTRFFGTPRLMRENDRYYKDFMKRSDFSDPMYNYEHTDMFYWEYRFGSWGMNVYTGQEIFNFEVTMPMNNRRLIDMFLWYPRDARFQDKVHKEVIKINDGRIAYEDNKVKNDYFKGKRVFLEKLYYHYRTMFYRNA